MNEEKAANTRNNESTPARPNQTENINRIVDLNRSAGQTENVNQPGLNEIATANQATNTNKYLNMNQGTNTEILISTRPMTEEERQEQLQVRIFALKTAIVYVGWMRFMSIPIDVLIYFVVSKNAEGSAAELLKTLILLNIIPSMFHGSVILYGVIKGAKIILQIAAWMCFVKACCDGFIGTYGFIYFCFSYEYFAHAILALVFLIMFLNVLCQFFYDFILIVAYIKLLFEGESISRIRWNLLLLRY